jgi:hypothetical protein
LGKVSFWERLQRIEFNPVDASVIPPPARSTERLTILPGEKSFETGMGQLGKQLVYSLRRKRNAA